MLRKHLGVILSGQEYVAGLAATYAGFAGNILVQILLVPLYLDTIGREGFGTLVIILGAINLATIGISWLNGSSLRMMGEATGRIDWRTFSEVRAILKATTIVYSVLLAIVAFFAIQKLSAFNAAADAALPVCVYIILSYEFNADRLAMVAIGRQALSNILYLASILIFAALAWPILKQGGSLRDVFWAMTAGIAIARVASVAYWRQSEARPSFDLSKETAGPLFHRMVGRLGTGYLIYGLIITSMTQADTILLGWLGGAEVVAAFILLWKMADVATQLIWRLPEILTPILIRLDEVGDRQGIRDLYWKTFFGSSILSGIAALIYAFFGDDMVSLWVGPEHAPADGNYYLIAGLAIFLLGSCRTAAVFAHALARLRTLCIVAGLELVGKLTLLVFFLPTLDYAAPLAALAIVHTLGVLPLYLIWLPRKVL
jgi:O-antigen/teichoic acid export membrane protein